jgi:putative hydrolase
MILHDLHVHTLRSSCGTMTVGEVVARAAQLGIRSVAITDHGLAMGAARFVFHIYAKRFPARWQGVRVYKGIEANVLDPEGTIDVPFEVLPWFDLVALGMHPIDGLLPDRGAAANTDALIAAFDRNPFIDILVHPTQRSHPHDMDRLLPAMARHGIAFEVNDCTHLFGKSPLDATVDALQQAVALGVPVVCSSDAHVVSELGVDDSATKVFERAGLDIGIAVNRTDEGVKAFVRERRERRKVWVEEQR